MWMIKGSVHDNAVEVPCIEIERLATRGQVLMAAQGLFQSPGAGTPLSTLAHEIAAKDPLPGIDGIESWGARAFDLFSGTQLDSSLEFRPMIPTSEGSHINGLTFKHGDEVEAEAFHWPEAIVANVSGLDELIIESPDGPVFVPEYLYPTRTGMTKRSFFEWRAYLGAGTLIVEGESEFEEIPADPKGRWIARVPLLRSVGVLIGRIVHWMGRDAKPSRDPSFGARLKHFERIHPDIAARYPDLRSLKSAPGVFADRPNPKPTLIFVHGTLSCAIPNLALLDPLTVQTFRFEHDTFQSISTNAKELIAAVRKLPKSNPLYLVAHSRGGLVARLAARELTEDYRVIVRTYGTPHLGTPLANVGGRLLNTLLAMGRTAVGGIFSWDPASLV